MKKLAEDEQKRVENLQKNKDLELKRFRYKLKSRVREREQHRKFSYPKLQVGLFIGLDCLFQQDCKVMLRNQNPDQVTEELVAPPPTLVGDEIAIYVEPEVVVVRGGAVPWEYNDKKVQMEKNEQAAW